MGRGGGGGIVIFRVPKSIKRGDWWGERGGILYLGCRIAYKGAMGGARGGEYYISKPRL